MAKLKATKANFIDDVQVTTDCLTGRAGLNLFARYLRGIGIYPHFSRLFASVRKNSKGLPIDEAFKQIMCFFFDGTSRHLTYFDDLAKGTRSRPLDIVCEMPIVFRWITPWRQPSSLRLKWSGTHRGPCLASSMN